VLDVRHHDGANQLGDEPGGLSGVPYSDYTGYTPVNAPMDIRVPFDPASVHDPNQAAAPLPRRQRHARHAGLRRAQWQRVTPFAMASSAELRSRTGPATFGTEAYREQCRQLVDLSAALTDEQKMIAEYWADGPTPSCRPDTGTCSPSRSTTATEAATASTTSTGRSSSSSRSPT
jgi:hypothetical protein